MKTSIAVSLLALVAPIFAVPMEALDPRHISIPGPVPTGSGFPPVPTTLSHHHGTHKTGGFHSYGPTGRPFPTGTRPSGTGHHSVHPHPTGGYYGSYGPRYIHSSLFARIITYTTTGPKPPPFPRTQSERVEVDWHSWQANCPTPFICQHHILVRSWSNLAAIDLALFFCRQLHAS